MLDFKREGHPGGCLKSRMSINLQNLWKAFQSQFYFSSRTNELIIVISKFSQYCQANLVSTAGL